MKEVSFVFILLFLQVSGSFLAEFQSAISNIQHGFGKLIGDVFTDVKDTVHCTISTVEHVLVQNGILNKRSAYKDRCKVIEKPQISTVGVPGSSQSSFSSKIRKETVNHDKQSTKRISVELGNSITAFHSPVTDVLDDNMKQEIILDSFKYDTKRLAEISDILRGELDNMSNNIKNEISKLGFSNHKDLTLESIFGEIKVLTDIQRNSKNVTEAKEIRRILDKVRNEMELKRNSRHILDDRELEEIRKELHTYASSKADHDESKEVGSQQNLMMKQSNDSISSINKDDANNTVTNADVDVNVEPGNNHQKESLSSSETSSNGIAVQNAKQIIEDSQHTDQILEDFFKGQQDSVDVFGNLDMLDFGER